MLKCKRCLNQNIGETRALAKRGNIYPETFKAGLVHISRVFLSFAMQEAVFPEAKYVFVTRQSHTLLLETVLPLRENWEALGKHERVTMFLETKRTLLECFTERRQSNNIPNHSNASAAVSTHFNSTEHSLADIRLIHLDLQPSKNTARRKTRQAYIIERGRILFPVSVNRRNKH